MYFCAVRGKGSERSMARSNAAAKPLSALLILALLLLNFSVVSLRVPVPVSSAHPAGQDAAHASALSYLVRDLHDSQDPETTACRCAFRQVIRSSDPVPAMLALFGTLPVCPAGWTLTRCALLSGLSVPRNAERIAAFLHDLAAAL